jgi:hypothetical protein
MLDGAAFPAASAAAAGAEAPTAGVALAADPPFAALALFAESLSPGPPALAIAGATIKPRTTAHVASARITSSLKFKNGIFDGADLNT